MDATTLYSTKPYSPPNKDSEPYKWVKAALSTSPIVQGALIGAGIGYFQGQSWELAATGALGGAIIAVPGVAYGILNRSIPMYIRLRHGVDSANPRFKALKMETEQWLKDLTKLSDRIKHVTFLALGITVTYYCLPKSSIQGFVSFLPAAITNLPSNLQAYANTPSVEPGLEGVGKTVLQVGLFLSYIATKITQGSVFCLGFRDFEKFVASSALVFSLYKGGEWIGSFKSMQPISKYVKDTYQNPPAFFDLMYSLGSASLLYRFGTYLKTLPLDENKFSGFIAYMSQITHLPSYLISIFSSNGSQETSTFGQPQAGTPDSPERTYTSLQDQFFNFWHGTIVPEVLKACSFETKSEITNSESIQNSESTSEIDTTTSSISYTQHLRGFLYHASPWLLLGALAVHTIFRYYVPLQRTPSAVTRRAATLETLSMMLNVVQTAASKTAKDLVDYFPALKRNRLNGLYETLQENITANDPVLINTTHGQIVQAINSEISKLKVTLTQLKATPNADPKVKFETATLLIKAFELKLEELQYRLGTDPHPANFNTRKNLVLLAQAHAFFEISKLYKEQITLAKELKNQLENMNAAPNNVDIVSGSIMNLEKYKAQAETDYRGKQLELSRVFTRITDWDVTLDRIFDTDEVHLSYFQEIPQSIFNLRGKDPVPAGTALDWLNTLPVPKRTEFLNNPMKTLAKLVTAERNGLRALAPDQLALLGFVKTSIEEDLFPEQGVAGHAGHRAAGSTAEERTELRYLALNG